MLPQTLTPGRFPSHSVRGRDYRIQSGQLPPPADLKRYRKHSPAAGGSKADKQARMMERKTCFISDAGNWRVGAQWGEQTSVQRLSPHPKQSEETDRRNTGMWKQQSAPTVTLKLVSRGLISIILIVLGTVNLQFQGQFISISLRPALRIMAANVVGKSLHLVEFSA